MKWGTWEETRIAWYAVQILARIPRGLWRIASRINGWRTLAATRDDYEATKAARPRDALALTEERRQLVRSRTIRLAAPLLAAVGAVLLVYAASLLTGWGGWEWLQGTAAAWWPHATAAAVLLAGLAAGEPAHTARASSLVASATPVDRRHNPTPEHIRRALAAAVPDIARAAREDPDAVRCVTPPTRSGQGWAATIELPPGISFAKVTSAWADLASAFQKPKMLVSIERGDHEGMIRLWVGDKLPTGPVQWPHADHETVTVHKPFTIGEDRLGRPVTLTLWDNNLLICGQPGSGKTVMTRVILCAALLDPNARVFAYDLKADGDFLPLEGGCERVVSGDEDDDIAQLLADLRMLDAEVRDRKRNPDKPRHPIVICVDEAHIAFAHRKHGREVATLFEDVFRRGRSARVHVILSTQRGDSQSIPRPIAASATLRMCGAVESAQESNLVLGAGQGGRGYSAAELELPEDQGTFWLKGGRPQPVIVRGALVDTATAKRIAARAAGRTPPVRPVLTLVPNPDPEPEPVGGPLVDHIARAWVEGDAVAHPDDLAAQLAETFPHAYAGLTAAQLADMLPGVPGGRSAYCRSKRKTVRGYLRRDLTPTA